MNRSNFDALRARLMPWVMAAVRLGAGWVLSRATLPALLAPDAPLRAAAGTAAAVVLAGLLLLGLLAFAWPRTCVAGAVLLAAALGAAAWLWQKAGFAPPPLPPALAVIAVLALGDWLTRRVQRRLDRH